MAFKLDQLDKISFDDAQEILDSYVDDAIDAFFDSPEGQDYIESHSEGGHWISYFIDLGYVYGEATLPKMTKRDVEILMEDTLPRKITILDPSEAEDAIPELIGFWQFLKREYQLKNATAILAYFKTLEEKFPEMMCDPSRGGPAKSFMLMGLNAGYDMTTEEGMREFQMMYNLKSLANQKVSSILQTFKSLFQGSPQKDSVPTLLNAISEINARAEIEESIENSKGFQKKQSNPKKKKNKKK